MAETARAHEAGEERRFIAFKSADRVYALPAQDVSEIVRLPFLARVPQAPPSLLGLANLRGRVPPVATLRAVWGGKPKADAAGHLALVLAGAAPAAIAIEGAPILVQATDVQTDDAAIMARAEQHVV